MSEKDNDVAALVRMLAYARREAQRLGFGDCARMIDVPIAAIRSGVFGAARSSELTELDGLGDLPRGPAH